MGGGDQMFDGGVMVRNDRLSIRGYEGETDEDICISEEKKLGSCSFTQALFF